MTVEVQITKPERPFNEALRCWSTNDNWMVLTQETTLADEFGHSHYKFRNYAIPLTLEGNAYAAKGGFSIVEAVRNDVEQFGEFIFFKVIFSDNSRLIVEQADNSWDWTFKNATNGLTAGGTIKEDKSVEALARGITAAQAHITQT